MTHNQGQEVAGVALKMRRGPNQIVRKRDLQQIEKALRLVSGNFVLAARLVGLKPAKFRNTINGHPALKERWGHTRRGRPRGRVCVKKVVFGFDDFDRRASRFGPKLLKTVYRMLPLHERQEVLAWLQAQPEFGLAK